MTAATNYWTRRARALAAQDRRIARALAERAAEREKLQREAAMAARPRLSRGAGTRSASSRGK